MFLALLLAMQTSSDVIVLRHDRDVAYTRTDFETACGAHVIQIRFRNGPGHDQKGRVDHFLIDSQPVVDAAQQLQTRAARRFISRIGVLNCGLDEEDPVIRGVMELPPIESQLRGHAPNVWFRIRREDDGWRIVFD